MSKWLSIHVNGVFPDDTIVQVWYCYPISGKLCCLTFLLAFTVLSCYHYKVLLLIAIYFSLHIVSVAITQTKNRSAVAPAPEKYKIYYGLDTFLCILKLRAKTVNDESEKVDEVRTNNKEVENEDFLTISKIVEQKQIFEKRLKYRKVNFKI